MVVKTDDGHEPFLFHCSPYPSYIEVFDAGLSLRFSNHLARKHSDFVHAARCNRPIPSGKCDIFYFEMLVVETGQRGAISIGLCDETADLLHQPGVDHNSFGYRGLDGRVYAGSTTGRDYSHQFMINDVIGCGISFLSNEVFFTRNGVFLGTAATLTMVPVLYATIGLGSSGEIVTVNFGETKPFTFDIAAFERSEREKQEQAIAKVKVDASILPPLVRSYLAYSGYSSSLSAFDQANIAGSTGQIENSVFESILPRQRITNSICLDQIQEAISFIQQLCPDILDQRNRTLVQCQLLVLDFVKLARAKLLPQAIQYAQTVLHPFCSIPDCDALLRNALSLLVSTDNEPQNRLLSYEFRENVAAEVNKAILQSIGARSSCGLELFLKQLMAVHQAYRDENSQMGKAYEFDFDDMPIM